MTDPIERLKAVEAGGSADPAFREDLRARLQVEFESGSGAAGGGAAAGAPGVAEVIELTPDADRDVGPRRRRGRGRMGWAAAAAVALLVVVGLAVFSGDSDEADNVGTEEPTEDAELVVAMDAYCISTGAGVAELVAELSRPVSERRANLEGAVALEIEAATAELDRIFADRDVPAAAVDANERTKDASAVVRAARALSQDDPDALGDLITAHADTLRELPATAACRVPELVAPGE